MNWCSRGAVAAAALLTLAFVDSAPASTLFVGSDANSPLGEYALDGSFIAGFGAGNAQAAALDGMGHVYLAYNGNTNSTVQQADHAGNPGSSFAFDGVGGNFANYITDMAYAGGALWISGYNGMVYNLPSGGSVLSSFDTASTGPGIASDGQFVYTTGGYGSGAIQKWNPDGTLVSTIVTGLTDALGIGYDSSASDFWVGGTDLVSHVSMTGGILSQYAIPGAHTAIEVGDVGTAPTTVPDPTPFALTLSGGAALILAALRKRLATNV